MDHSAAGVDVQAYVPVAPDQMNGGARYWGVECVLLAYGDLCKYILNPLPAPSTGACDLYEGELYAYASASVVVVIDVRACV